MSPEWLLFLPQVPSTPSSLRVAVWRRLRDVGAAGLQHGVWVLPRSPTSEATLRELAADLAGQGGDAYLLAATALDPKVDEIAVERSRSDRDREYGEFLEQTQAFLAELDKETAHEKFEFAELEENEQDLAKLEGWLGRIRRRDFCSARRAPEAEAALLRCRQALADFTQQVYQRAGLEPRPPAPDETSEPDA